MKKIQLQSRKAIDDDTKYHKLNQGDAHWPDLQVYIWVPGKKFKWREYMRVVCLLGGGGVVLINTLSTLPVGYPTLPAPFREKSTTTTKQNTNNKAYENKL